MKISDFLNLKTNKNDMLIALTYLLDKPKSYILLNQNLELNKDISKKMVEIKRQLNHGLPLQYAIGFRDFYNITLNVDKRALIPRFETEIIIDYIINNNLNKDKILDIGAGSGAITLSLAYNLPRAEVIGVDIEDDALSLSNENLKKLAIHNAKFIKSDLFSNINDKFDIIISNPPYINEIDYNNLDKKLYYEPKSALYGGKDGLFFYKKIIKDASKYMNERSSLIFEIGYDQKDIIKELLSISNFKNIKVIKDYNDFDRFIIAERG